MSFATRLKIMRNLRGFTQQKLAHLTGIPNSAISQIETGQILPAEAWERLLKDALAWPADESIFVVLEATETPVAEGV